MSVVKLLNCTVTLEGEAFSGSQQMIHLHVMAIPTESCQTPDPVLRLLGIIRRGPIQTSQTAS
jgi:hypothetical protein